MIKVSVVIPVYNVELYLREALDSVINQTLKEIEIIVVNDGSIDSSLEIIKEYESTDNRIIVINQENQGLSGARNSGLRIARGEYIYFMDSDDYISLDALEICYITSSKNDLDFVFFDAQSFTNDDIDISRHNYDRSGIVSEKIIFSGAQILKQFLDNKKYRSSVCLDFIKLDYLKKINLEFYPKIIHEDELFTFILFLFAEKTSYINRKFFQRRVRVNSIMTSGKSEKNVSGYFTVAKELNKVKLIEKDLFKQRLLDKRIQDMVGNSIGLLGDLKQEKREIYRKQINEELNITLTIKNKIRLYYPTIFKIIKTIKERIA